MASLPTEQDVSKRFGAGQIILCNGATVWLRRLASLECAGDKGIAATVARGGVAKPPED